jgi:hypothetical protein
MTASKSRPHAEARAAACFGLAVTAVGLLVSLTLLIVRASHPFVLLRVSGNDQINRLITYEVALVVVTVPIVLLTAALIPSRFSQYFRVGHMGAPVGAIRVLRISGTETWKTFGITLTGIVALVTAAVVMLPVIRGAGLNLSPYVAAVAVFLAASNAFVEEYLTRFQVVASLVGRVPPERIAVISAVFFGIPRYLGTPGQLIGVLMSTLLGWLLAKSVLETRGLGWAWIVHFSQDVIIFVVILGAV